VDAIMSMEVELHDEVVKWLDALSDEEWGRAVVIVDRLADLGFRARMPLSRSLGDGLFELRFTLGRLLGGSPTGSRTMHGSSF